jgi:ribosomal protein S15P/S13E
VKTQKENEKPLKRVFQAAGCVVRAKIKRLQTHLKRHSNDFAARDRLKMLEQSMD